MSFARFDRAWRYWLATAVSLAAGLLGWPAGVTAAIVLTAVQVVHYAFLTSGRGAFPLQVRVLFLAILLAGLWPPLALLHWMAMVGVWANVLVGYCLAARLLSLLPWNRRAPLTAALVARTFLSPPHP